MRFFKSIYTVTILLVISGSSIKPLTFFKLSPKLQETYLSWNKDSGSIVMPFIEYRYKGVPCSDVFFSDKNWFDTAVEIPCKISEFNLYLPSTMLGKYIKFTFNADVCGLSNKHIFENLDPEILKAVCIPCSQSLLHPGLYSIDVKYTAKPVYVQCILTRRSGTDVIRLVAVSDVP